MAIGMSYCGDNNLFVLTTHQDCESNCESRGLEYKRKVFMQRNVPERILQGGSGKKYIEEGILFKPKPEIN